MFDRLNELPNSIKESMPKEAQELYMKVFNSTWSSLENLDKTEEDREIRDAMAHKSAWNAIKQKFADSQLERETESISA